MRPSDDLVVVYPAVDLSQFGAHAGSKALFTKVGDVLLVLTALGGAVPRQGREEDLPVVATRSQEGNGDIENFPEGGLVSQHEVSDYMEAAVLAPLWER